MKIEPAAIFAKCGPSFGIARCVRLPLVLAAAAAVCIAWGAETNRHYRVEDIAGPPGIDPNCTGLAFLPDGRLVATFDQGKVFFYQPSTRTWTQFADGMHTPMGVIALSEREIVVVQRSELTRLVDTDGNGVADDYHCISDAWGLSGNYHEFAFGVVRDRAGNFYVPLGSASGGGVSRYEKRGEFRDGTMGRAGHYSPSPYRGWVVRVSPDGALTPIASGFRQPSGISIDSDDHIFVTDNQGDWVGTSKIHHVVKGGFYGQPAGLVWRDDFRPRTVAELDQIRTEAAALLPHALLANSLGQPAFDLTNGKFGPFSGQMIVPDYVIPRLVRVMRDEVAGEIQCASTTFFDGAPLRTANVRIAFAPDGSLWCSQSERKLGWPGAAGIQRVVWKGTLPMDVQEMRITDRGFDFTFTQTLDVSAGKPEAFKGTRYYYKYQPEYGSPRTDIHPIEVKAVTITEDGRKARVEVADLKPGFIYQFDLSAILGANQEPISNRMIYYTANRLRDGTLVSLPRPEPTGENAGTGKDKPAGARIREVD